MWQGFLSFENLEVLRISFFLRICYYSQKEGFPPFYLASYDGIYTNDRTSPSFRSQKPFLYFLLAFPYAGFQNYLCSILTPSPTWYTYAAIYLSRDRKVFLYKRTFSFSNCGGIPL